MRLRFVTLACLLIAALASCSSNKDKELKVAKLVSFEPAAEQDRLWSASVGAGQGRKYLKLEPAVDDNKIFIANANGRVKALTREEGDHLWQSKTGYDLSGGLGAGGDVVGFGTLDGRVVALSQETGEQLWQAEVSSEVLAAPAIDRSVFVVQTVDARVFAFDTKTGEQRWSYDHLTPVLSLRGNSPPVIVSTQVVCAFDNGQLVSFSLADGSRSWEVRVSQPKGKTDLERIVDVDGRPVADGGLIYAAGYQGSIMAIGRAQGNPIWKNTLSTYHSLALGNGNVYASTERSRIIAFNSANGDRVWENELLLNRGGSAPAAVGDYLVVIDNKGYAHVMRQQTGEFVLRFKPKGDGFKAPVTVIDDTAYIFSDDGVLSAYQISAK